MQRSAAITYAEAICDHLAQYDDAHPQTDFGRGAAAAYPRGSPLGPKPFTPRYEPDTSGRLPSSEPGQLRQMRQAGEAADASRGSGAARLRNWSGPANEPVANPGPATAPADPGISSKGFIGGAAGALGGGYLGSELGESVAGKSGKVVGGVGGAVGGAYLGNMLADKIPIGAQNYANTDGAAEPPGFQEWLQNFMAFRSQAQNLTDPSPLGPPEEPPLPQPGEQNVAGFRTVAGGVVGGIAGGAVGHPWKGAAVGAAIGGGTDIGNHPDAPDTVNHNKYYGMPRRPEGQPQTSQASLAPVWYADEDEDKDRQQSYANAGEPPGFRQWLANFKAAKGKGGPAQYAGWAGRRGGPSAPAYDISSNNTHASAMDPGKGAAMLKELPGPDPAASAVAAASGGQ